MGRCPLWVISGQSAPGQNPANVRCCPKADIGQELFDVRIVPEADIRRLLFDVRFVPIATIKQVSFYTAAYVDCDNPTDTYLIAWQN